MKVALYQDCLSKSVNEAKDWIENHADYCRVSEIVEVEFPPLSDDTILQGRVKLLDAEIEKVRAELTKRVDDLLDQKQRLLAITHNGD